LKILLTGGAGFLGRHVTRAALDAGHEVLVLSRHPERVETLPSGARALGGDLTLPETLSALVAAGPDAVVHAAAVVAEDDPQLRDVNVGGTGHLLAALAGLPTPPRFVHVSSFAVEDIPSTQYSETKREAEELVKASPLPWVVLRPTLIYGAGDGSNTPALVERMRAGNHWLPGGGRATRIQPVHVADVAGAILAALERDEALGHTFRLAGAEALTVRAWREAVREASGGSATIRSIPLPLFGLLANGLALLGKTGPRGVLSFHQADHAVDISDAQRLLAFQPCASAEGLAQTFAEGRLLSGAEAPRPTAAA
jgi:NADH dehydrogenase